MSKNEGKRLSVTIQKADLHFDSSQRSGDVTVGEASIRLDGEQCCWRP